MKSAAIILMFVCLFMVFQLNHGLFCHNCKSQSDLEPDCKEIVDDRFLRLCRVGERCAEIFYLLTSTPSQVFRICVNDELLETMKKNYYALLSRGVRVGLYMCDFDGCNKKYNLKRMQIVRNYTIH